MKPLYSILLLLFALIFSALSCDCDDVECAAFEDQYKPWLGFGANEKITYTNNINDIELQMHYKGFSGFYEIGAKKDFLTEAECTQTQDDCRQTSEMIGVLDTALGGNNNFRVAIINDFFRDELNLYIYLYDFQDHFKIKPDILFHNSLQKFHETIALNGVQYHDVISTRLDTTENVDRDMYIRGGPQQRVWKVYYSKSDGLIAFKVRKPFKATYYLKP